MTTGAGADRPGGLTPQGRARLRRALREVEPWLAATEVGPQAVDAGMCDRCDLLPRLVPTCGPGPWPALCLACVEEVGLDAWCDGHEAEGRETLDWVGALPPHWDVAVTAWWVATGELALDSLAWPRLDQLDPRVRGLLPAGHGQDTGAG
jgi:hypothetical protein